MSSSTQVASIRRLHHRHGINILALIKFHINYTAICWKHLIKGMGMKKVELIRFSRSSNLHREKIDKLLNFFKAPDLS